MFFSNAVLTHYGALYLLQQFFQGIKLRSTPTQIVGFQQLNYRYSISDSVLAILYPIILGLGRIKSSTLLQQNGRFQYLASLLTYPNPTTLRRFLERFGEEVTGVTFGDGVDEEARAFGLFGGK